MALTKDQFKTLMARAVVDPEFRRFLLAQPKKAARQLGMALDKKDEAVIQEQADRIRADGAVTDKALQRKKAIIPWIFQAPSGASAAGGRRRRRTNFGNPDSGSE